jgi:hypothetical protein
MNVLCDLCAIQQCGGTIDTIWPITALCKLVIQTKTFPEFVKVCDVVISSLFIYLILFFRREFSFLVSFSVYFLPSKRSSLIASK